MTFEGCTQERAEGLRSPNPRRPPEAAAAAVVGETLLTLLVPSPPPSTLFEVGISTEKVRFILLFRQLIST